MSNTYFSLASGTFAQDWSDLGLITLSDVWAGVPSIEGYRGDDLVTATGVDPQTVLGTSTVLDVNANQTNPDTFTAGGVSEFHIANPTIALNGSGTADAPYIVLYLDATGREDIRLSFNARDLDGSIDNAVQALAVQYRVGASGSWTNLPAGFVADATTGPSLATLVTPVSVTLPAAADGAAQLQLRVITTNAVGNDEWVGIDDIVVTSQAASGPTLPAVSLTAPDGSASESAGDTATVRFARSGPTTGDLTVSYTLGGTAAANDYTPALTGTVVIPDGQSFLDLVITPVDDSTIEPSESLTLTLLSQPTYTLGASLLASVTITDNDASALRIHDIQGRAHRSAFEGQAVTNLPGIVTALASNGFYLQDPQPDGDDATSEGLFVFTSSAPTVVVGASVLVSGTVQEFRSPSRPNDLSVTEIVSPSVVTLSTGHPLPAATVLGAAGRALPSEVIDDDPAPDAETAADFDPVHEGIDFWESLEGMRVQIDNPVTTSITAHFGTNEELWVLADGGSGASSRTERGGSLITADDFNPERIQLDDLATSTVLPDVGVGTRLSSVTGVVNYGFGNFEVLVGTAPTVVQASPLQKEVTPLTGNADQLTVATFNVENLDPGDGPGKFDALAQAIVDHLRAPDIVNLEEVQDNNGATNDSVVDASQTMALLIQAIVDAGGPLYAYRQIDPVDDADGGEPGGNIRVVFLFNPDRVDFVDGSLQRLSDPDLSDGDAFANSRKPLVGDFTFNGSTVTVVGNHFASKGGDDALFGLHQPPLLVTEAQRVQQAAVVQAFVQGKGADAQVVVAGDLNDFEFSAPLTVLESAGLTSLIETLPADQRYTYNFEGNAQALDHLMASGPLMARLDGYDVVHINSEFVDQVSDHDPVVARFTIQAAQTVEGTSGRDLLVGGTGDDTLRGGIGRDAIVPGPGSDRIVFTALTDFYDVVLGFQPGEDHLDLTALLAGVGYGGSTPVADGYLDVRTISLPLPIGGTSLPLATVVTFDADGAGTAEPARPMVVLVGVEVTDPGVLLPDTPGT